MVRNPSVRVQLRLEQLEDRTCPAAVIDLRNHILTVLGREAADRIVVAVIAGKTVAKVINPATGAVLALRRFASSKVGQIVIDAGSGNDDVRISATLAKPARIFGSLGNDTLRGGAAADEIFGGHGNDQLFGQGGDDQLFGGPGSDQLDGGDGTNVTEPGSPSRTGPVNSAIENDIIVRVNLERTSRGLTPLVIDDALNFAAASHSTDMAQRSNVIGANAAHQHTLLGTLLPTPLSRIDYAGFEWQSWGENIAYGYTSAATVMQAWMNSSGHRANILNPNFTRIGVGVRANASGTLFYTQNFGTPF